MPADTGAPHNLPYPLGPDPVAVPADLQKLATATDEALLWMQSGTVEVTGDGVTGSSNAFAVVFPEPFAEVPKAIIVTAMDSRYNVSVNASNPPTIAGFAGFARHLAGNAGSGATFLVAWAAFA